MKKIVKKMLAISMVCVFLTCTLCIGIGAENMSQYLNSPHATAGVWQVCETAKFDSTLAKVCGGDVGIWFYDTPVGLQMSFYRSNTRKCYMNLWACDDFDEEYYHFCKAHEATFTMVGEYYRPATGHRDFDINPGVVDDDSNLELYMAFYIEPHSRDTSISVPAGLLLYAFWAY